MSATRRRRRGTLPLGFAQRPTTLRRRAQELRNIWQHVYRRRVTAGAEQPGARAGTAEGAGAAEADGAGGADEAAGAQHKDSSGGGSVRRRKREEDGEQGADPASAAGDDVAGAGPGEDEHGAAEDDAAAAAKKARVVWSVALHQQFVNAVNMLGVDKAVPKRILDLMGVQGLTRENVASHLQKYRLYLRRLEAGAGMQSGGGGGGGSVEVAAAARAGEPAAGALSSHAGEHSLFGGGSHRMGTAAEEEARLARCARPARQLTVQLQLRGTLPRSRRRARCGVMCCPVRCVFGRRARC